MEKELELMLDDFIENHKNIIIKDVNLRVYEDFWLKSFQTIFALFHQELNDLFSFMNQKNKINKHFNAGESRYLLGLINELRDFLKIINNSEYKVIFEKSYVDKIKEVKNFLTSSWWSPIPNDYEDFDIIKFKPIFHFESFKPNWNKIEEKQIKTEANFNDNIISIVLQKEVFSHIKELLNWWHYFNAVEEAYKIVRVKLRNITGEEQAHKWFQENNYELIFWNKPKNKIEKDFFDWVKYLHMSIQFLRNEKAHTPARDIDKNLAIHYIVLASLAYDLIDR